MSEVPSNPAMKLALEKAISKKHIDQKLSEQSKRTRTSDSQQKGRK